MKVFLKHHEPIIYLLQNNQFKLKILALSLSVMLMSSVPISAVYSDIARTFSEYPAGMIDLMTTIPGLAGIASLVLVGILLKRFCYKNVAGAALVCIILTGLYPAFGGNLISLIISRSMVGMGCSILSALTVLLITNSFKDNEQKKMMGLHSAVRAIGSMSMMIIVYLIADTRWRSAFLIYLLAVPILIILILLLPKDFIIDDSQETCGDRIKNNMLPFTRLVFYCFLSFFYLACLNTLAPGLSHFIEENKISSGNIAGIAMCFYMIGSFLSGMTYKRICLIFKKYTLLFSMLVTVLGIFCIALTKTISLVIVGCTLQGIGASIFNSASIINAVNGMEARQRSITVRIILLSTALGGFLSPFISGYVAEKLFGPAIRYRYTVAAICMSLLLVITLVYQQLKENQSFAAFDFKSQ